MKVTKIKLNSYLHFKNGLEIDLTYPEDHEKAGQPLDRVCFLGQSGTGKTTLLHLIKYFVCEGLKFSRTGIDNAAFVKDGVELYYKIDGKHHSKVSVGDEQFLHFDCTDGSSPKLIEYMKSWKETLDHLLQQSSPLLISFPFSLVRPDDFLSEEDAKALNKETGELEIIFTDSRRVWDFDSSTISFVWNIVFSRVEQYRREFRDKMAEHFSKMREQTEQSVAIMKEFKAWEESHPNPLKELADGCLTELLKNFHLEVEVDLLKYEDDSLRNQKEIKVILRSKSSGKEIPYQFLSTGTKQLLLTAIPLFYLHPRNSLILFDQPETSLYPNVQYILPEVYEKCAGESNQLFFATHSPIVASAFDPWEVVELEFESDGSVHRKEYFKGDRRAVGNYYIIPKLLRWDSSYRILFDVEEEGNEERRRGLMALASMEGRIRSTSDQNEKGQLVEEYKALAMKLDWQIK
jgi:hypothetical protein